MPGQAVLIVTNEVDPHADRMVVELQSRGTACFRFHPDGLPAGGAIASPFGTDAPGARLTQFGRTIAASDIVSVWYRKPKPFALPAHLGPDEAEFARRELTDLVAGFFSAGDWFWVSHPDKMRAASLKTLQLAVARRVGLRIPRTIVSNDPDEIRRFRASCPGDIVYKTLKSPIIGDGNSVCFTSIVTEEHLANLGLLSVSGGIFQEYIDKALEIRVVAIGNDLFGFEIHSQSDAQSRIDWRRQSVDRLVHRTHALPAALQARLRELLRAFDLRYSAIDLILTPAGEYVFLESNPGGQYAWLEELTHVPLTARLADMLIAGRVA
jgi:hypothetical protein